MKLKTTLTLAQAQAIMAEALRVGREEGMLPLTIVVLDAGGKLIGVNSEDGSGLVRFDVAFGKGWGARLGWGNPAAGCATIWRRARCFRPRWPPRLTGARSRCRAVC